MLSSKASASKPIEKSTQATTTSTTTSPTRSTASSTAEEKMNNKTEETTTTEATDVDTASKPKPRLLNLNVDDLQTFANALHNQSHRHDIKKPLPDLSDVTLDGDDDDDKTEPKHRQISDKFYSNLQAPFHPLLGVDRGSSEVEMEVCKENEVTYKVGLKSFTFIKSLANNLRVQKSMLKISSVYFICEVLFV